jgi:hypothetical protein
MGIVVIVAVVCAVMGVVMPRCVAMVCLRAMRLAMLAVPIMARALKLAEVIVKLIFV